MRCAVIYYSKTGKTRRIAKLLRKKFLADLYFVEPETEYKGFAQTIVEIIKEKTSGNISSYRTPIADLSSYDTVFIGFPVWAGNIPDFLQEYIISCNLDNKIIIPFATAAVNGKDACFETLQALLPDSNITEFFYTSIKDKNDPVEWISQLDKKLIW